MFNVGAAHIHSAAEHYHTGKVPSASSAHRADIYTALQNTIIRAKYPVPAQQTEQKCLMLALPIYAALQNTIMWTKYPVPAQHTEQKCLMLALPIYTALQNTIIRAKYPVPAQHTEQTCLMLRYCANV
ncbi:Hypothetical predicted protein [Pelobates cultripes]|uniref:Uncharacterized protein n=1 Tax=Pelobates cultripes TaxID=61616 RepID=A0AAD1S2Y7_PELCU|nr:Hypothetical predicted protein [Pelobates cultripes]